MPRYVYRLWVVIGFILLLSATVIAVFLPIWEARTLMAAICKRMFTWNPAQEGLKYNGTDYSHHPELVDGKLPLDEPSCKPLADAAYVEADDTAHGEQGFKAEGNRAY